MRKRIMLFFKVGLSHPFFDLFIIILVSIVGIFFSCVASKDYYESAFSYLKSDSYSNSVWVYDTHYTKSEGSVFGEKTLGNEYKEYAEDNGIEYSPVFKKSRDYSGFGENKFEKLGNSTGTIITKKISQAYPFPVKHGSDFTGDHPIETLVSPSLIKEYP